MIDKIQGLKFMFSDNLLLKRFIYSFSVLSLRYRSEIIVIKDGLF